MPEPEGQIDMSFEVKETGETVDMTYYLCHPDNRGVEPLCKQTNNSWSIANLSAYSCYEWVVLYNELFLHGVKRPGVRRLTCRVNGTSMI